MGLVRGIATAFQNGQVLRLPTEPKPHAPLIRPKVAMFASRPCCGADGMPSGSAPPLAEPPVWRQKCKVVSPWPAYGAGHTGKARPALSPGCSTGPDSHLSRCPATAASMALQLTAFACGLRS